jgi:hypothetical protein
MAFEPITAVIDLVRTGIDKFLPSAMPEAEKEKLKTDMAIHVMKSASDENSSFRNFVLAYEGEAKDIPKAIVYLRSLIRPAFTILVGYLDFLYFTATVAWSADKSDLLKAVNLIILLFWFGERAITNSGIVDVLKAKVSQK